LPIYGFACSNACAKGRPWRKRGALDRVLTDEVRHCDFGWLLLEWLARRPEWPALAELIRTRLPGWLRGLYDGYAPEAPSAAFDPAVAS
jgi:hypothetical protein